MKRLALLFVLILGACAPAAVPTFDRNDGSVRVTVEANATLYDTTLSMINARTNDERCTVLGESDIACILGTIPEGRETYVQAETDGGFSCIAYAYLDPGALTSYRPYPCKAE